VRDRDPGPFGLLTPDRWLIAANATIEVLRSRPDGSVARVSVPLRDVSHPELEEYVRWRQAQAAPNAAGAVGDGPDASASPSSARDDSVETTADLAGMTFWLVEMARRMEAGGHVPPGVGLRDAIAGYVRGRLLEKRPEDADVLLGFALAGVAAAVSSATAQLGDVER
jgi:hypothetical protein